MPDAFSDAVASSSRGANVVGGRVLAFGAAAAGPEALLIRFPISLPRKAQVSFATIEFACAGTADAAAQTRGRLGISLLDTDDQGPFSASLYPRETDLLGIETAGAPVRWDAGPCDPGGSCRTSDLSPLVRAFLRRQSYAPGKHLALRIAPNGVARGADPFLLGASAFESGAPPVLVLSIDAGAD